MKCHTAYTARTYIYIYTHKRTYTHITTSIRRNKNPHNIRTFVHDNIHAYTRKLTQSVDPTTPPDWHPQGLGAGGPALDASVEIPCALLPTGWVPPLGLWDAWPPHQAPVPHPPGGSGTAVASS